MNIDDLRQFEWHDLPLEEITFTNDGFQLVVTPYNEQKQAYDRFRLTLHSMAQLTVDVCGQLGAKQMQFLEISSFHFEASGDADKLSGEFGILPDNAGFWKVAFQAASWSLVRLDTEDPAATE